MFGARSWSSASKCRILYWIPTQQFSMCRPRKKTTTKKVGWSFSNQNQSDVWKTWDLGYHAIQNIWGDTQCWAIFEIPKVMVRTRTIEKHVEIKWRVYIPKKGWEVQEFWALKYYGSDRPVVISDDSFWQNMHNHSVRNNSFMNSGTSQRSWLEGTAKLESVPSLRQIAVENHAMCSTDSVSPIFYTHLWFRSLWGGLRRCKSFVSTKSSDILFSTGGCLSKMPKAPIKIPLIFQKKLLTFRRRRPPRNVKSKKGLSPCKVKKSCRDAISPSLHQVFEHG